MCVTTLHFRAPVGFVLPFVSYMSVDRNRFQVWRHGNLLIYFYLWYNIAGPVITSTSSHAVKPQRELPDVPPWPLSPRSAQYFFVPTGMARVWPQTERFKDGRGLGRKIEGLRKLAVPWAW